MDACKKLESVSIAANCRPGKPTGIASNAVEKAEFDLLEVPGKSGQVLQFETAEAYDSAVKDFDQWKIVVGPHRYGNRDRLLFTQLNDGASMAVGKMAKDTIAAL